MTLRTLTLLAATAMMAMLLLAGCDVFTRYLQHEVQDKVQDQISRVSEDAIVVQRTAIGEQSYVDDSSPESYIYVIDRDDTNETRSIRAAENKAGAVLSPDGGKIAFVSGELDKELGTGVKDVYVMDADGTDKTQISTSPSVPDALTTIRGQPAWSPDSERVAFTSYTVADASTSSSASAEPGSAPAEEVNGIYVADASGRGDPSQIFEFRSETPPIGSPPINLTWSPDGEKIAFYDGISIVVIKDDKNGEWEVEDHPGEWDVINDLGDAQPPYSWSPDGKRITFVDDYYSDLYVINADGSGRRRLANTISYYSSSVVSHPFPTWSPDSKKLAFFCPAPPGSKGRDLCMINADGTEWKRLALDVD